MATILAAASGNWSSPGTWTGGVVPGAGDIAVANGKTVTIDLATITCASLRTTTDGGASASGTFTLSLANTTINADIIAGGSACLTGVQSGLAVTINGSVTGGSINFAYGINMTSGSVTVTTVTGGSANSAYGINMTGGSVTVTTVTGGSSSTAHGVYVNGASATAAVTTATGVGAAAGLYVNQGVATLYEALGNGYGPAGTGSNTASAVCTSSGRLGVKKITFGPLGQCPISGNARLIPDAAIPTPFFIPLDSDYPDAGSGTNPAFTTATTLSQQVAATVGEIMRTQP